MCVCPNGLFILYINVLTIPMIKRRETGLLLTVILLFEDGSRPVKLCGFYFESWKMSTVCAANVDSPAATLPDIPEQKKPLKPCCACPETKKVRDAW